MSLSSLQVLNGAARYLFGKHAIELDDYENYVLAEYTTIPEGSKTHTINIIVRRSYG